ncbi:hypothetical protein COV58_02300 [Candidatus Roizmanbacteria bacterium CG11_big_fil_rev_8_21_14_0_20_36_8]|uniref:SpoVT-AbrB domain-containing protein n=1 Tax=Candidatus Roizmanbacteria bacterium CG11_big_fil_rev_8_21_14_0_20_36_8 TaxID=1974856 RepID=A0A2M6IUB0_9BACT|nr:MAG: hypothetical protein COV58_02300 [Candidatus Roizmanbacteria bacterium CG11_big_fil_rev_8_21_14_0_20_36_8]
MIQTIIKVGNSLAVTLPAQFIRNSGWKAGDKIQIQHDAEKKMALITPKNDEIKTHLTPEFFEWLEKTSEKYKDAIVELSNI